MGEKLVEYYALAEKLGGLPAKVKLAAKTCVGSLIAATTPDTPQNIERFRKALQELFPQERIPS